MNLGLITHIGKTALMHGTRVSGVVVRHAPEILLGVGLVGGAATTVSAVRATLKCEEVLAEAQLGYEKIDEAMNTVSRDVYTGEQAEEDIHQVHAACVGGMIRNIAPVVVLGAVSTISILCGYNVLSKRYTAVIAAYTALEGGFQAYRKRVVAELGEEADYRFRTGSTMKKIEREIVDEETGESKIKKVKTEVIEEGVQPVDYTINFGREAIHIRDRKDITHSLDFVILVEQSVNLTLRAMGYITLNEVRKSLGVPEVSYGQIVGWTLDGTGDDRIDLNPRVVYDEELGCDTIILDPNVDGIMFHKITDFNEKIDTMKTIGTEGYAYA